jgi:intraflagellar transport protein 46
VPALQVLDEPAARQSDPTVLTLQLRQLSKEAPGAKSDMVGRIEHTDEHKAKKIQQWIGEARARGTRGGVIVGWRRT